MIDKAGVTAMPDALLVGKDAKAPEKAVRVDIERRAHAVLTRRPARLGLQAYAPERLGELKADLALRNSAVRTS